MRKYRGQNVLDHKPRPIMPVIVCVSAVLVIGIILLLLHDIFGTVVTATIDNYKVKLTHKVSWDNYCLTPKLQITNLSNHAQTDIQANIYQGPCGHNSPSSWLLTGDFNHDGHMDFAVLNGYGSNDTPLYTRFIYDPSAKVATPFVQQ